MRRITRLLAMLTTGLATAPIPAPPPLHQGQIFTKADRGWCLTGGPIGTIVSTRPCDNATPGQQWFQASTGRFYNGENCISAEGTTVRVAACEGGEPAQDWWFVEVIRNGRYGPCLNEESRSAGIGTVRLRTCTWTLNQKWISSS
ncbi:ricin-type beta-trefoil lectin domain protein [Actinoplanes regularis]|uniref:ricin-type beta-trefoil lectin domain protein n=1 Tax=Actinoplanes regularis TaxID=52697 RepID=UPI0024A23759|nr:ricin-type beta-trefoil lectin domain protein [Actinoplanes regularis]GLW33284.1 hypothetical protein Areg01_62220 [Actinoplanes regularis]